LENLCEKNLDLMCFSDSIWY